MKLYRFAIVALGAIALSGCSTYQAKTRYQAEMLRLCEEQGAPQINRVVELPREAFKDGHVVLEYPAPGTKELQTVGKGRYVLTDREVLLKSEPAHRLTLGMLETSYVDSKTGEVLGLQRSFRRNRGDSLAPNSTVSYAAICSAI